MDQNLIVNIYRSDKAETCDITSTADIWFTSQRN